MPLATPLGPGRGAQPCQHPAPMGAAGTHGGLSPLYPPTPDGGWRTPPLSHLLPGPHHRPPCPPVRARCSRPGPPAAAPRSAATPSLPSSAAAGRRAALPHRRKNAGATLPSSEARRREGRCACAGLQCGTKGLRCRRHKERAGPRLVLLG